MRTTKAWIFAVGFSAMLIAGATVALGADGPGQPQPATSAPATTLPTSPDAAASAGPATSPQPTAAASGAQVQQVLVGLLAEMRLPADPAGGPPAPVAPAEIEARLRAELAKVGLHP